MLLFVFQEMSESLLSIDDFNVIAVDWGGGSASLYSQSAANTRLVGLEVAFLINFLKVRFLFEIYFQINIVKGCLRLDF